LFRSLLRGLKAFRVEKIAKNFALLDRLQNFAEFPQRLVRLLPYLALPHLRTAHADASVLTRPSEHSTMALVGSGAPQERQTAGLFVAAMERRARRAEMSRRTALQEPVSITSMS
jgi:hypothetical protein